MRLRLAALASLTALTALTTSPAPAATTQAGEAGIGIRLVDGGDDPRSRSSIVDHVAPGGSLTRTVQVVNEADRELPVELYAAAAAVRDGSFTFANGREGNELTSWTAVAPSSVTLAPGATADVAVTVVVPGGATTGERFGVVWAVLRGEEAEGVRLVHRVGVRMYVSIGRGPAPLSDFVIDSLRPRRAPDGRPAVIAQVRNTGGRALDLIGNLNLVDGPGDTSAGPFPVDDPVTLAPGDSAGVTVTMPADLPAGPWRARLTLRSGTVARTAEAEVTFPAAGEEGSPVAATPVGPLEDRGVVGPVAAALAVLVAAAIAVTAARRRRAAGDEGRVGTPG